MICAGCGEPLIGQDQKKFCSRKCFQASRLDRVPVRNASCAQCGIPLSNRWQTKFCSPHCAHQSMKAPLRFCKCGTTLSPRQKVFCSPQCNKRPARYVENSPHDEMIARMAAEGATWKAIAKACGICVASVTKRRIHLGITRTRAPVPYQGRQAGAIKQMALSGASYDQIMESFGISRSTAMKYRRQVGLTKSGTVRRCGPERKVATEATVLLTRDPIQIPLREVYTRGMMLNLPQSKRGDLAALNAAVKRETPDHPGYVLANHKMSRVGLYAR